MKKLFDDIYKHYTAKEGRESIKIFVLLVFGKTRIQKVTFTPRKQAFSYRHLKFPHLLLGGTIIIFISILFSILNYNIKV